MRKTVGIFVIVLASALALRAQSPPTADAPSWLFPLKVEKPFPKEDKPKAPPGSKAKPRTQEEIDDLHNPPDWYPDQRPEPPSIVVKGRGGDAMACGACHLMSGHGHPESSDLTGIPADYIIQQMKDFKAGTRIDVPRMNLIAKAVTDEEVKAAAEWFAKLKTGPFVKVVEQATVPKTFLGDGRMRFAETDGSTEPIGNRIISVPEDPARARMRDPNSGFIAYVPPGSLAKGKELVETGGGGKTLPCTICHGPDLKGLGNTPRLVGQHPIYTARQLYRFKDGSRNGQDAALMKPAAANLSDEDIIAISAYLGSLAP